MFDDIIDFILELVVIFFYQFQSMLFISLEVFVNLQNAVDFFFLCSNDSLQNLNVIVIVVSEIRLSFIVSFALFRELIIIERG